MDQIKVDCPANRSCVELYYEEEHGEDKDVQRILDALRFAEKLSKY